jgi:integrase
MINRKLTPHVEPSALLDELQQLEGAAPRALEFSILVGARSSEVLSAEWAEIDFDAKTWNAPAAKMKDGKPRKVPLGRRAIDLLALLPRQGRFVFSGGREGRPLLKMALVRTLQRMGHSQITVHDIWRATRVSDKNR